VATAANFGGSQPVMYFLEMSFGVDPLTTFDAAALWHACAD
jgi:hypothetical protein